MLLKSTYWNIIKLSEATTSAADSAKRKTLIQQQAIFILVLELDLQQLRNGSTTEQKSPDQFWQV
jgi:hypothetical protein